MMRSIRPCIIVSISQDSEEKENDFCDRGYTRAAV